MCRLKYYNLVFSIICALGIVANADVAKADGDPSELIQTQVSAETVTNSPEQQGNLLPDEQAAAPEEAVATVTAEGDFLLPTYLLPGETATVERTTTVEKVYEKTPSKIATVAVPVVEQTTIAQKTTTKTTEPDDFQSLVDQAKAALPASKGTVRIVQPVPPTRLVPFPANPVPNSTIVIQDRVELPTGTVKGIVRAPAASDNNQAVRAFPAPSGTTYDPAEDRVDQPEEQSKRKLLIPLASIPKAAEAEPTVPAKERVIVPSEYADQVSAGLRDGEKIPFHMPHEIRITFYPRESAFSGQTLKWVRAFALAAIQDPRLIVEVRASCAEADLQDARVKLVKGVLMGAGLSTHQIVVNYTERPVDTMLLRAIPRPEATEVLLTPKDVKLPKSMSRVKKW